MKKTYYRNGRGYFSAQWIKRRKTYKLWYVYPRCEDVPFVPGWNKCPVALVESSRKLKGRPSNRTLTQAWTIR